MSRTDVQSKKKIVCIIIVGSSPFAGGLNLTLLVKSDSLKFVGRGA